MNTKDHLKHGNMNRIECEVRKYNHYQLFRANPFIGETQESFTADYIVGSVEPLNELTVMDFYEREGRDEIVTFNDSSLLLSLLHLSDYVTSIPEDGVYSLKQVANYPQPVVDAMIKWCELYGLPFEADDPFIETYYRRGINIIRFRAELFSLGKAFNSYLSVIRNDTSVFISNNKKDIKNRKENLEHYLNKIHPTIVNIDLSSDAPSLKYVAPNLISAAYSQLLFNCTDSGSDVISVCENCGKTYLKTRATRKYCNFCHGTRYQITRDRQRKEKLKNEQAPE